MNDAAQHFQSSGLEFYATSRPSISLAGQRRGRDSNVDPAGAEKPAHFRFLCGTARYLPRSRLLGCHRGGRRARHQRRLLFWRRRARNNQSPAGGRCSAKQLSGPQLAFAWRVTGDLVEAMRACPRPIVAAIDGVCAGAGAVLAMASDLCAEAPRAAKMTSLFVQLRLAGADMGACNILHRSGVRPCRRTPLLPGGRWTDQRRRRRMRTSTR